MIPRVAAARYETDFRSGRLALTSNLFAKLVEVLDHSMPHFFFGDELGSIKHASFSLNDEKEWTCSTNIILEGSSKARAVQTLVLNAQRGSKGQLAAARSDGSICVLDLEKDTPKEQLAWNEARKRDDQKFVGLAFTESTVYSCTSNGALQRTELSPENTILSSSSAILPTRLAQWRISSDAKTFAYAGDEVELSIWDVERTFSGEASETAADATQTKKRKSRDTLLSHEVWRAKNLPNDNLNLRQPVRNTAFTYLDSIGYQQQFLVGTQFGDVRRYDTRAAHRPVCNWKAIGKVGGIGAVEVGLCDNQAFVADKGSNLFALDLRNGKVSYGYKGIAGAITSIAPAAGFLTSGASDRFLRLHSTFPPATKAGDQQEEKGQVLNKTYVKVTPGVAVWDSRAMSSEERPTRSEDEDEDEEAIWDEMEDAESDDETDRKKARTK
ncbi:hypothetical protein NM688_g2877 [Phlebia brevispora]|uniref:Uncharacterized protein n=1 Tax=Phlebia brevispora TaxID=194682 RepID=A0ACC1T796_9APHY|nr:hypothetical protein NM688_g2877 [Phlebia brevispora]